MKLTIARQPNKNGRLASVLEMEAAVLLHVMFWVLLSFMFGWGIHVVPGLLMVLLPVLMVFLARRDIFGRYLVFYALVLMALVVLVGYKFFTNGFSHMLNLAGNAVNETVGYRFVPFSTTIPSGREGLYLTAAETVLMVLTSAVLGQAACRKKMLPVFLLTVIPVAVGLFLLLKPGLLLMVLFLAALLLFFIHCAAGTGNSGFGETGLFWQMTGGIFAFLLLFLLIFYNYSGSARVQTLRDSVSNKVRTVRYAPEEEGHGMPSGKLDEADSLHYDGTLLFNLDLEQPAYGYLREFAGSDFVNGEWQPLSSDAMTGKYNGMDQWLLQHEFYPWMQLSRLYELDATRTGSAAKTGTVRVENVGLYSDKLHLFYEAVPTQELLDMSKPREQAVFAKGWHGVRSYTYTTYAPIYDDYGSEDLAEWAKTLSNVDGYAEYEAVEELYRSFVHDNYLTIDDAYKDVIADTGVEVLSASRYPDIVYGVRKYLQDHFTYSESIEKPAKGTDALIRFASTTRSGYDAHFASLATLMFREAGVPARYMEGYYLSPKEMAEYADTEEIELEVYDNAAHAWTEIYEDGVGWVPVEVTPGYFSLEIEETPQLTESVQRISKRTPKPFYDSAPIPEENSQTPENVEQKDRKWIGVLIGVIAALALLLAAWFGSRKWLRNRIAAADSPAATRYGYRFLMRLLKRRGYAVDREDPYALVETLGEPYRHYLDLVYQDVYSSEEGRLTPEERREAADYVLDTWDHGQKNPENSGSSQDV